MALHESVLLNEALEWIAPGPGKTFVDGTLGLGGHAHRLMENSAPDGRLLGFDKDERALREAKKVLSQFGDRIVLIHDDFKNVGQHLDAMKIRAVDGMFLDLGVSSMQIDEPERGFSFQADGPLDMRMNPSQRLTAKEIVNQYPEQKLLEILWTYGEERFARRIVTRILETRRRKTIETTGELAFIIGGAVPKSHLYGRIHPSTRTFQALRIAVNGEIEALQSFLSFAPNYLNEGGRMVIISFHSLEDRAVKTNFRENKQKRLGNILTKKPITATDEEAVRNPRSRSAKMRVFEKRGKDVS